MSGTRSDRFFSNFRNEFLRFNDLSPSTAPYPFWTLVGGFFAVLLTVEILGTWASTQMDFIGKVLFSLGDATVAFMAIPFAALIIRRYSDIGLVRSLMSRLQAFRKRNLIGARLVAVFLGLSFSIAFVAAYSLNNVATVVALLLFAAMPSATGSILPPKVEVLPQRHVLPSLPSPTGVLTPSPTGSSASNFVPPTSAARIRAELVKPSKTLLSRVGFWVAVALALSSFLVAWFPSTIDSLLEPGANSVQTEVTDNPEPTQSEEPSPTASSSPATASPSSSPSATAGVSGGVLGDTSTDNDGSVTPAPAPVSDSDVDEELLDPRFRYCTHAIAAGYGPYYYGIDPEYAWYNDRDSDGIVCER